MKIVIATAVYYPMINGIAVFSHNLAVGLAKRGHEVLVLTPSQSGHKYTRTQDGVKVAYLKSSEVKVYPDQIHDVPPRKKIGKVELPRAFYKDGFKVAVFPKKSISKELDKFKPDVIHVQVSDPIGLSCVAYAKAHGVPVVTTEHNQPEVITDPLGVPRIIKKPVNALLAVYMANRQSKSDYVTMPTQKAIDILLKRRDGLGVPMEAVSNGVDLVNFKPGVASDAIYKKYKIPRDVPVVLYVGRVDPEKNVGLLLRAFQRVLIDVTSAILVVVGDGVDRLRLEKEALYLGIADNVKFLGRVLPPNLYELYKIGTVFATGSEVETQGIVLIEAAATGLPLIAVDKGAVSEVCCNGVNGFLCKPGAVDEIASAMVRILSDKVLRRKFSKESVRIASEHDFERTLDKFERIYQEVCEQ